MWTYTGYRSMKHWLHWQPPGNTSWHWLHQTGHVQLFPSTRWTRTLHLPIFDKCRLPGFAVTFQKVLSRESPFPVVLLEGWEMLSRSIMAWCLRETLCCSQRRLVSPTHVWALAGISGTCETSFRQWPAQRDPGSELLLYFHLDEAAAMTCPGQGQPRGKGPWAPGAPSPHRLHHQCPCLLLLHLLLGGDPGSTPLSPMDIRCWKGAGFFSSSLHTHTEGNIPYPVHETKKMWWQWCFQEHWFPEIAMQTVSSSV